MLVSQLSDEHNKSIEKDVNSDEKNKIILIHEDLAKALTKEELKKHY